MTNLNQLFSSKVRAEFFRIFFGIDRDELHLREIERRSGLAIGTVRQEAEKLCRLGLINKRRDGNRVYFCANPLHPLFPEISKLVLKTSGLSDVMQEGLEGKDIEFAFIFGSIATGTQKPDSDIDLFVIGKIGLRELTKHLRKPSELLGREINAHVMMLDEFEKRIKQKEHFVTSVLNAPKLMIIGNENDLEKLG